MSTQSPSSSAVDVNPLLALSNQLADLIEQTSRCVVAVQLGRHESVSAVLWQPGVAVTVAHALRRAGDVTMTLPDGRHTSARLAGVDGSTDLAVFRVDDDAARAAALQQAIDAGAATEAAAAATGAGVSASAPAGGGMSADAAARTGRAGVFAEATSVRTGHWVFAVARGAHGDVAADHGIVGRVGPAWQTWRGGRIDRLIRLDGGLQAGFSGAPIVDARGAVIGIGTSALARGYGIVIPARTVQRVADALLTRGRVAHGYLGIGTQQVDIPAALAQKLGVETTRGLLVTAIAEDSPAERAGWLIGDILLAIDNEPLPDVDALHAALSAERIGAPVRVALARGGALIESEVTVGERPRAHC
jgi:S1-C subfamily serine protease